MSQHFESYGEKSNPKEVVDKAIESGILQAHNKKLIHLTLDPDPKKIQQFYNLLDS